MLKVYSLLDRKLAEFGNLVLSPNDEAVVRSLRELLEKGGETMMSRYPEDFALYRVGEWDPVYGVVVPLEKALVLEVKALLDGDV